MRKTMMTAGVALAAAATPAGAQDVTFKPIVDARIRYEHVEQQGIPLDADAVTMRVRAGGELTRGRFSLLAEAEGTLAIDEDYNSGVNGRAAYALVPDPENVDLNRLQVQYRSPAMLLTVGRQRINLDDQRFVGSVAWRQNEQTFDAARVEYTGAKNLKVDVTYAWAQRTIWGIDGSRFGAANRPTHTEGDNIFANVAYKFKPGTLTLFAYFVDQDFPAVVALARNSSQTFGGRFAGATPIGGGAKLSYMASYARQGDDRNNPVAYDADYAAGELGLDYRGFKLTGGYELLGADLRAQGIAGGYAFQTPYATLHKFNGWADKFLTTPQTGLQDYYGGIAYTVPKLGRTGPLVASFTFHRFDSDQGAIHYGDEYDAQLSLKLTKQLSALVKYAQYERQGIASYPGDADTRKVWAELDFTL